MTETLLPRNATLSLADALHAARRDLRNVPAVVSITDRIFAAGDVDRAIAALQEASRIAPDDFLVARTLSGYLATQKRLDEALTFAQKAVAIRPQAAESRLHIASILINQKLYQEALTHLTAHAAMPDCAPVGLHLAAAALLALGRTERAIQAEQKAVAMAPETIEFQLSLASLLMSRARLGDAMTVLGTAQALAPDDARIHRTASGAHQALGDVGAALQEAEAAVRLAPDNDDYARHLHELKGTLGLLVPPLETPDQDALAWAQPARRRRPQPHDRPIMAQVRGHLRIIHALMIRDIHTRHSRATLGYFWAIFEPISHLLTLGVMFAYLNTAPPPIGNSLFEFYCSGLLPYLMFSHIQHGVMQARNTAGSLLSLPAIRTTDVILAKTALELATELLVGAIVFSAFGLAGYQAMPENFPRAMSAILLMALLALGIGTTNMVIQNFLHSWDTLFQMLIRLLYFASGIYYSPISMPDFARNILQWNPVLQGVELFRTGFFPQYQPFWLKPWYFLSCVFVSLAIGFALEKEHAAADAAADMIAFEKATKTFRQGGFRKAILDDVTLALPAGKSIGIFGANGAGKSTLVRLIAGVEPLDRGRIRRFGTVSFPLGFGGTFHPHLTGLENVRFLARVNGTDPDEAIAYVEEFAELGAYFRMLFDTYSAGMGARLAFGACLAIQFDLYLIDEVTSVGDAHFRRKCLEAFAARASTSDVLIISHDEGTIRAWCDAGAVLHDGKLVFYEDLERAIEVHRSHILKGIRA